MFLQLQSIRKDEASTYKELILTDVPITSQKTQVEVANSGKTMTFYGSIGAFSKISENFRFRFGHSNYRLFERSPEVPGTLNNGGLTVYAIDRCTPFSFGIRMSKYHFGVV